MYFRCNAHVGHPSEALQLPPKKFEELLSKCQDEMNATRIARSAATGVGESEDFTFYIFSTHEGKRDNALEAMVQEMLAQHKAQMLDVLMDKVKEEVLIYTDSTNDAMACFMGDMQCQFNDQIKRLVQREVALQLEAKLLDNKKEKDDNNKQGQIFFRRDMFKKYMEEDQSEVKEFDTDFMEEESMNLLANIDGV